VSGIDKETNNTDNRNTASFNWNDSDKSLIMGGQDEKKKRWLRKGKRLKPLTKVLIVLICVMIAAVGSVFVYAVYFVPGIETGSNSIYSNIDLSSIIYDSKG